MDAPVNNSVVSTNSAYAGPQRLTGPSPERFHSGAKTTVGGKRWYDYNNMYMDPYQVSFSNSTSFISSVMWNDTNALVGYTGTVPGTYAPYEFNQMRGVGCGLDPMWSYWNETGGITSTTGYPVDFAGNIAVAPYNAYTVDSIQVVGWYTRGNAPWHNTAAINDTLVVTFVQSNGGATSDLPLMTLTGSVVPYYCPTCVSTMNYVEMFHDAVNNRAAHNGGGAVTSVYKFILGPNDTNALAPKNSIFPRPGHVPADPVISFGVTAGNFIATSVTFISGDPSATVPHSGHPWDTIRISDGTSITYYKLNNWEQEVNYAATGSSTTETWPPYDGANRANGFFDIEGNGGFASGWPYNPTTYTEQYNIVSLVGPPPTANVHQAPRVAYHIVCPTCLMVGAPALGVAPTADITDVKAFPNPADNKVAITWSGVQNTNVTVTLTNMLGQVVATQTTANNKVMFNTTSLPDGVYSYSFEANGERSTGRVSVAH